MPTPLRPTALLAAAVLFAACGNSHDHDHDHGPGDGQHEHGDAHVHTAPHGGTLVPCGEEFANVELLLDPEAGTLTAWTLGPHAVQHLRLPDPSLRVQIHVAGEAVELELSAVASELTGETVGDTSEFAVTDAQLKGLERFEGTLRDLTLRGRSFEAVPFSYPD